jgi:branched-chain amino acid transport system substrate-binding protein
MKIFRLLHTTLLLLIILFPSTGITEVQSQKTFTIGISLPLTGDLAEYGTAVRNGIQLAVNRFPTEFSKLDLRFEDNRYDAKTALTILQKFDRDKVDLVYSWGEVPFNAIAPILEAKKLPLTAYSLDHSAARNTKYIVLTSNDPKSLTAPLVNALRKEGLKHFGIVKTEDPYINASIEGFTSNLISGETIEIISTVLPGEMDLKTHALHAKSSNVDAIGVYLYPGQISSFYRSIASIHISTPTFGTDIFESRAEINAAGKAMEGALYPNFQMPTWFAEEYVERYKNDAQISYAYNGYAWAAVAAGIFTKLQKKVSSYELIEKFKSVSGTEAGLNFQPRKDSTGVTFYEFPIVVRRVVDGKFETINP